jgi:hypothetical protein
VIRLRQDDKFLGILAAPSRRDGNAIFIVDEMVKFAGVEELTFGKGIHV